MQLLLCPLVQDLVHNLKTWESFPQALQSWISWGGGCDKEAACRSFRTTGGARLSVCPPPLEHTTILTQLHSSDEQTSWEKCFSSIFDPIWENLVRYYYTYQALKRNCLNFPGFLLSFTMTYLHLD